MIYYKVIHFFITKQKEHFHCFNIGIYESYKKAEEAIKDLKTKQGFSLRPDRFYVLKIVRFKTPKFLNKTFWADGFENYTYSK